MRYRHAVAGTRKTGIRRRGMHLLIAYAAVCAHGTHANAQFLEELTVGASARDGRATASLTVAGRLTRDLGHGVGLYIEPRLELDNNRLVDLDPTADGGLYALNAHRARRGMLAGSYTLRYARENLEFGVAVSALQIGTVFEFKPTNRLVPIDLLDLPFTRDQEVLHLYAAAYLPSGIAMRAYLLPVDNVSYLPFQDRRESMPYPLVTLAPLRLERDVPPVALENLQGAAVIEYGAAGVTAGRAFDNIPGRVAPSSPTRVRAAYDPYAYVGAWYSLVRGPLALRTEAAYLHYERGSRGQRIDYAIQVDYRPSPSQLLLLEYLGQEQLTDDEGSSALQGAFRNSLVLNAEYSLRRMLKIRASAIWRIEPGDGALRAELRYAWNPSLALVLRGAVFLGGDADLLGQFRNAPFVESRVEYRF